VGGAGSWTEEGTDAATDCKRCAKNAGETGRLLLFGATEGGALSSQLPDAINVAAHS